jgi:mannose-6-phosphate isomerase-like protein (cupin superfamily)
MGKPYKTLRKENEQYTIYDFVNDELALSVTILNKYKSTNGHKHDYEELYYFTSGQGVLVKGEQKFKISNGDFVKIEPGEFHQVINTEDVELAFVCSWRVSA